MENDSQRIQRLEASVADMEVHIRSLQTHVITTKEGNGSGEEQQQNRQMRDNVWCCGNCGARLGVYNVEKDELRVRYKDFCVYITPGKGGKTMVPCRRCGEQNTLQDTREN